MNILSRLAAAKFMRSLHNLSHGQLTLTTPDGQRHVFCGAQAGTQADLIIHDWRVASSLAVRGDNGFALAYQQGWWSTTNLPDLITLGLENAETLRNYIAGSLVAQLMARLSYLLRLNTRRGSRKNIHAHYDLGNDFYSLWLDPTMTYSSGLFGQEDELLGQAQDNKYDRILSRLAANSGSILEIGCGWGGFADRAVQRGDYDVKAITISQEQHDYAARRLGGTARIDLEDYRDLRGKFDNIVSIEMFEALGERYWKTYFERIRMLLQRGGKAIIQTITIDDSLFESYRRSSDMIRSLIFPGGMLPSPQKFRAIAAQAGLRVSDEFHFGLDYARTIEHWLAKFDAQKSAVEALGFDQKFIRLWRFYLAACIAGFRTGQTSVMQVELQHA